MTKQETIEEYVIKECRHCRMKQCNGIYITENGKAKCNKTKDIKNGKMFNR